MERDVTLEDMLRIFKNAWRNRGFLTREHEEMRFNAGQKALTRFFIEQEKSNALPTYVEEDFSFMQGNNRISGRWDRIDVSGDEVCIIDYKTSEVRSQKSADEKTRKSLQLLIYAEAYRLTYNRTPDTLKFYFLETGFVGQAKVDAKKLEMARTEIDEAAKGIRERDYTPKPNYIFCSYCPFSNVCPASVR